MNIVLFIYSLSSGGAERVTVNLANAWSQQGRDVTIVTISSSKNKFYELSSSIRLHSLNLENESKNIFSAIIYNLKRIAALRQFIKSSNPDYAIGMMSTANILLCISLINQKQTKLILSERTYPPAMPLGNMWEKLRKWCYPLAHAVVLQSREGLNWLNKEIPTARGRIIPNSVSIPLPSFQPRIHPNTIVKHNRKLLLGVGRLSLEKGFDRLIIAFSNIANKIPEWDLVIVGEGSKRKDLQTLIDSLALSNRIKMPGRAGNIAEWYTRADIYALTSRFEGFPNSLVEAMAYGCPAISFDCDTGPRDIIRHRIDGLLITDGNIDNLSNALIELMFDDKVREKMSQNATDVCTRYSLERILSEWDNLLFNCG